MKKLERQRDLSSAGSCRWQWCSKDGELDKHVTQHREVGVRDGSKERVSGKPNAETKPNAGEARRQRQSNLHYSSGRVHVGKQTGGSARV